MSSFFPPSYKSEQQPPLPPPPPPPGVGVAFYPEPNSIENEALQYWKVYFDFSYYLLLLPFHFKFNRTTGFYEIRRNLLQQILRCIVLGTTGIYFLLKLRTKYIEKEARSPPGKNGNGNPTVYFELAYYFFDTFYLTSLFIIFGFRSAKGMERIFNEIQQRPANFRGNSSVGSSKKVQVLSTTICFLCLSTILLYLLEVYANQAWDSTGWINYFYEDGKNVLFNACISLPVIDGSETTANYTLTIFSLGSNIMEKVLNAFSDILFVMTVLLFRKLSSAFRFVLEDTEEQYGFSQNQILQHYNWLKAITKQLNDVMGIITFSFIIGNLPFYATNVFDIFKTTNIFLKVRYSFYCCYFFPGLVLAAQSSKDTDEIRGWLWKEENYSRIHPVKLTVIFHEVSHSSVGLAPFGCLPINYRLVGSIVSVILTYALLKYQFESLQ